MRAALPTRPPPAPPPRCPAGPSRWRSWCCRARWAGAAPPTCPGPSCCRPRSWWPSTRCARALGRRRCCRELLAKARRRRGEGLRGAAPSPLSCPCSDRGAAAAQHASTTPHTASARPPGGPPAGLYCPVFCVVPHLCAAGTARPRGGAQPGERRGTACPHAQDGSPRSLNGYWAGKPARLRWHSCPHPPRSRLAALRRGCRRRRARWRPPWRTGWAGRTSSSSRGRACTWRCGAPAWRSSPPTPGSSASCWPPGERGSRAAAAAAARRRGGGSPSAREACWRQLCSCCARAVVTPLLAVHAYTARICRRVRGLGQAGAAGVHRGSTRMWASQRIG